VGVNRHCCARLLPCLLTVLFTYGELAAKPTLVIGMDLLGSFDELIIDYKERKLLLSPHYQPCGNRRFDPFACS
jgi:hypothetical protein